MRDENSMSADSETLRLIAESPNRITTRLSPRLHLDLDYGTTPQIGGGGTAKIGVAVRHAFPSETMAELHVEAPVGWNVEPPNTVFALQPGTPWTGSVTVRAPERRSLENSTSIFFQLRPKERPVPVAVPMVFIGAPVWLRSEIFPAEGKTMSELLDRELPPERLQGSCEDSEARAGRWEIIEADGNDLGPCLGSFEQGVVYLRGFLRAPLARSVFLHVNATIPAKIWLNGERVLESKSVRPLRPNHSGNPVDCIAGNLTFRTGWNEILLKLVRDQSLPPLGCHVLYSDPAQFFSGLVDVGWTRLPWD
jgi:hypothetical protein